ncbi:MAG TPA: hypothetical protein VLH13_03465, partial [Methanomassiliicoccales archaeon]|nr:hypothetical protein [Methanomassiliicoccales archaeon]
MIFKAARNRSLRIGIGSLRGSEKVEASVVQADSSGYGTSTVFYDAKDLIEALRSGAIDAAVRGDLDSHSVMDALKSGFQLGQISRAALLQPRNGGIFLLAPVGIDEGDSFAQKLELAKLSVPLMRRLGMEPRIGIMSGGRSTDLGRSEHVDRTIRDGSQIVERLVKEGLDAKDVQLMIEDAV